MNYVESLCCRERESFVTLKSDFFQKHPNIVACSFHLFILLTIYLQHVLTWLAR